MAAMELIGLDRIEAAAKQLGPVIRRTPVVASRVLSERTGREVRLKCENLQRTGSFKPRGAYHRIANLPDDDRRRGVVAASAGNHAQGVAWSATTLGIDSTVFMPIGASLPKLAATRPTAPPCTRWATASTDHSPRQWISRSRPARP